MYSQNLWDYKRGGGHLLYDAHYYRTINVTEMSDAVTALSNLFDPEEYPPPSKQHVAKCSDCGEKSTRYKLSPANLCRQEHDVEITSNDVCGS